MGIEINIISIPMEGYDCNKPEPIVDLNTGLPTYVTDKTKADLAQEIYSEFINHSKINAKYKLYIFPHMYLRSSRVNPFSRGNMPYSLHIKSFYIKFKNQGGTIALTSSNLAVRDLIKWDNMILIENETNSVINDSAQYFYTCLIEQSIPIKMFDPSKDWTKTSIELRNYDYIPDKNPFVGNYYIAPFYEDSPDIIETKIIKLLHNAKERIYICAQHIGAYNYSFNSTFKYNEEGGTTRKGGFLKELLTLQNKSLDIRCLSQTFVNENGHSHGCRAPKNKSSFSRFIKEFKRKNIGQYAANSIVHSKFIIIDDILIISTCNFTPTQFIYLKYVNIPKFDKIPGKSYRGIHCEVGQFIFIKDAALCKNLIEDFMDIWNLQDTFHESNSLEKTVQKKCIKCGKNMKIHDGPYGEFLGCTGFPLCKHKENF
ncbi:topoisomerase DNA-binding C4 zinc finger domain-containing protein [Clostridium estertheticum]|uniref:topoisomerase DNA-binding C4 zinc finger domain-containing protein n=1 Tax=Clostridium estertheticum TaxID=238834 RepID=UPI001C7CD4B5|nr:topoisomerase DNA-binding C4 zinc finger domain-containing protein [Clostridium estertheticum]MBX4271753.1 hypothetical protein [Clostridium estertheticum]WLC82457.1 topoisomerase DNA-binding C4 zinc finger domain-containing protein [Clostridium estertheticum]